MASRLAPATTDGPGPTGHAPASGLTTQELEVIAHLGWYALDVASGRWVSSPGLDTIFGIDSAFDRSVDGWASLIHEADREAMLAYLSDEVLSARHPFDRRYRIVRADTGEERWVHGRGTLELDTRGQPRTMLGAIVDITEAQLAHDALTQSERRYRTIFEGASEAILIAEVATGRFRWVNHAARGLFGYTTEEFERLTAEDIHPPETWRAVRDVFLGQGDGQQTLARAVPCRKKDGSRLVVDIKSSTAILDGVLCNVGFFTDVTQLLRLQGQQRKLGQAMDQAGEGILITGPTAVVEYANPAFEQLVGRSASQMSGRGLRLFGTPIDPAMVRSMWNALTRGEPWNGDIAFRRRDGMERIAATSIAPVHDADGGLVGYVCVARDVTDETASRAERERLAAVVEQTSDSVVIADLQGTIEYVNAAFERVSGYARDEVIGHNPRILKSGMQSVDFYRAMWRRLAGGDRWTGTLINRRKDGELYEEEATISPIRGPGGDVVAYVAVKRDVTALRAAETNLERQLRERGEVTAALSRLTPQATPEQTGSEICDALLELPGVDVGVIFTFHRPGHAVPLAVSGPSGLPVTPGQSLPAARACWQHPYMGMNPLMTAVLNGDVDSGWRAAG